jgi:AcrR family transcriptional regulator
MPGVRLRPEDRRAQIVDAAFGILATSGFEGLRTRDVASAVSINSATLHYYFPTKEHLVAAIAERLAERLTTEKAPRLPGTGALIALRQQFADFRFYQEHRPDLVAVYRELSVRALRDEATRGLVERLNARWRDTVEAVLRRGVDEGAFRANLVPSAAATMIVAALWGAIALLRLPSAMAKRMCVEVEHGIAARGARK